MGRQRKCPHVGTDAIKPRKDRPGEWWCLTCTKAASAKWRSRNSEKALEGQRRRTARWLAKNPHKRMGYVTKFLYGITLDELHTMFENQEGLCAVCSKMMCLCVGRDRKKCRTRACVDHDHDTGEVRGLLCHGCNVAIGYANNSPTVLRNAAGYLEATA